MKYVRPKKGRTIIDAFNLYIEKDKNSDCLIWTGTINTYGNPKFHFEKKEYMACRFIYEYFNGVVSKNIFIQHKCNNKICVNPDHLYIKSDKEVINQRFSNNIIIPDNWECNPEEKCWPWKGLIETGGYGIFIANGQHIKAHRFAYEAYNDCTIPDNLLVCHKCDNPLCCNPFHLFLGTAEDNNKDRTLKGRGVYNHGSKHHNSKLTEEQVLQIRDILQNHKYTSLKLLADQFGVSRSIITVIRDRKGWNHI